MLSAQSGAVHRLGGYFYASVRGSEQGGAPQCATNSPVDCWLARGRFPYGSPKHPALKGAGCFSLYPCGLGRRTGIEQLVPAVCSGGSPKQAPRRGQDPALRVPQTKIQIPETGKGREDSRPFLRVSSVPSLQRRNKKAVQVLNGLLNKKGVPHRGGTPFFGGPSSADPRPIRQSAGLSSYGLFKSWMAF